MDETKNDLLIETLQLLAREFKSYSIPLIIAGGLSIYIKTVYLRKHRSSKYDFLPEVRSTKDIDIFLTSDIIVSPEKVEEIKAILKKLEFKVKTKYFQYMKVIERDGYFKEVIVDILSQPISSVLNSSVVINKPRIKPRGVEEFHAFYHNEAQVITSNLIILSDHVEKKYVNMFSNVFLPSTLSFIILKIHALHDRLYDESKDFGRNHAYDIFTAVLEMDENDWLASKFQYNELEGTDILAKSKMYVTKYFSSVRSIGLIRLRENIGFSRYQEEYEKSIQTFISDMGELFSCT